MKKSKFLTCVITTLGLLLSLFIVGCSCAPDKSTEHVHSYADEYTCHDRVCSGCGQTVYATTEHNLAVQFSCEEQNCLDCGEAVSGQHYYDSGYTCIDRECTVCSQPLSATTAHKFTTTATCVDRMCSDCGSVFVSTVTHNVLGGSCECLHIDETKNLTFEAVNVLGNVCYAVTGYTGSRSKIIIPATYENKPVVAIKNGAFSNKSTLISVTVPASVTTIGYGAFTNSKNLTNVSFEPSSKLNSIGENAFAGCSALSYIVIPNGVEKIPFEAFRDCVSLRVAQTPENLKAVESNAFRNCTALETVNVYGIEDLGYNAFYNCTSLKTVLMDENAAFENFNEGVFYNCTSLAELTIPNSVNHVGKNAFYGCNSLLELVIPSSVIQLNDTAFDECNKLVHVTNLSSLQLPQTESFREVITDKNLAFSTVITHNPDGVITFDNGTNKYFIGYDGYKDVIDLSKYTTINSIYDYALYGSGVKEIIIPSCVTKIGVAAFKNCSVLNDVAFSANSALKTIEEQAFSGCGTLMEMTIPTSVTEIKDYAFYGCNKLVLIRNLSSADVDIPDNVDVEVKLDLSEFSNQISTLANGIITYTVGEKVYLLAYNGREQNLNLTDSGVTDIYPEAFDGNATLKTITLPITLKTIGEGAFRYCAELTSINIPASVEKIDRNAFADCAKLESVTFAENGALTKIEQGVFENCQALKAFTLPKGVTAIEDRAFFGCNLIKTFEFEKGSELISIGNYAFYACDGLETLSIPATAITIGNYAFYECVGIKSFSFGENSQLKTIGNYAFYRCTSIIAIDLGNYENLSGIGEYAFSNCTGAKTIVLNGNVNYIYFNAFKSCTGVLDLYYGGSVEQWDLLEDDDLTNNEFYMDNTDVTNPAINRYYYYTENTVVDDELKYWYYNENGQITVWKAE